jgi:hypothetical protein
MEKVKNTKLGDWLRDKAPKILDTTGDLLPDKGVLGVIKRLVDSDPDITPEQKMEFERLAAETEQVAQTNVTERWKADMDSDVKIAKVIRPSIMIYLIALFTVITIWDSVSESFIVKDNYVDLLQILLLTTAGAYFAGRTIEKTTRK